MLSTVKRILIFSLFSILAFQSYAQLMISGDTIACNNDAVLLTASGGAGTYTWFSSLAPGVSISSNPTITTIAFGTITYTVVSGPDTATHVLQGVAAPTVSLGSDTTVCVPFVLDATTTGATYLWQDGTTTATYTVNASGTYSVEVAIGTCIARDTITVTALTGTSVNLGNDTTICANDTLILDATTPGATYIWQNGAITPTFEVTAPGGLYWVQVSSPSCGVGRDSINVSINNVSTIDLSNAPTSVCQSDTLAILNTGTVNPGANHIWDFDGAVLVSGSGSGPYELFWSSPGPKNVCLTIQEDQCIVGPECVTVNVDPRPAVGIGPVANQCFAGNSFSFSPTGTSPTANFYFWNFGAGASPPTSTAATPSGVSYATPGTKTVTLVVVENGCVSDTATVSFEVLQEPNANFGVSSIALCQNDCFDFTYIGPAVAPNQTYVWNFGANGIPNTSNLQNVDCVNFTQGGTYTVTLTVDNNGCATSSTQNISVFSTPIVDAGPNLSYCAGEGGVQLNATLAGGTAPFTVQWTCNIPGCGFSDPFILNPIVNPDSSMVATVQVIDANGCVSATDSVQISVNPKPIVDAGPDIFLCEGGPGGQIAAALAADNTAPGPFTYQWTPSAGIPPGQETTLNPYVNPDTTTIYTLIVGSANGCTSDVTTLDTNSTVVVHVIPQPIAVAGPDTAICFGETIQLQGFAFNAGPIYEYSWTPNDTSAGLSDSSIATPFASPAFTTTYSLVVNSNGCPSLADNITVTVNTLPTTSAGPVGDLCLGDSVQLQGLASGDPDGTVYSYQWTPIDGLSDPNSPTPNASPDTTTTYYLQGGSGQCEGIVDSVVVVVKPSPIPNILTPDTVICAGDTVHVQSTHFFTSTPGGPVVYEWGPDIGIDSLYTPTPMLFPTQSTIYLLTTSIVGDCPSSRYIVVEVYEDIVADIQADTTVICSGDSLVLSALGGFGSPQFTWTPAIGLSSDTIPQPLAFPDTTTTYYVTIQENACVGTDSITLTVNPSAEADYFSSFTDGCAPLTVSFFSTSPNATSYSWDFGDGSPVSNEPDPIHVFGSPGSYQVTFSVDGVGGCGEVDNSLTVNVADTSIAAFTSVPDTGTVQYLPNGLVTFTDASVNATTWYWDFGDGTTSSDPSPTHNYQSPGEYTVSLTVTGPDGCISQVTYGPYVFVSPNLFIPNVFSPNDDGLYDTWGIDYVGEEVVNLEVFDRWGNKIFAGDTFTDTWDGRTTGGVRAPEGVYYYAIRVGEKTYTGSLSLFR